MSTRPSSPEKLKMKLKSVKLINGLIPRGGQSLSLHRRVCGAPGGYSWEFLVELCHQVLQVLNPIQTKNVIFYTRLQT